MTATYEPLSAQDASFLYTETDHVPMHVGGWLVFDGAPFHKHGRFLIEAVRKQIASRLHLVPRYRKKLLEIPFAHPVLVDDPDFDVMHHVHHVVLAEPGSWAQQMELFTRVEARRLDPTKPLWEMWFVEGLEGDRVAHMTKTHHTLIDGVSSMDVVSVMMDDTPDPEPIEPPEWNPVPPPQPAEVVMDLVRQQHSAAGQMRQAVEFLSPGWAIKSWADIARGFASIAGLDPLPRTSLNQPIGRHRRFESANVALKIAQETKRKLGGTVNDVVLAAVTGGLRRLLMSRGEDVANLTLRALVPVSVREETERGALGNRVAAMFVPLPVGLSDPVEQLHAISATTADLKERKQALGAQYLTNLSEFAPPTMFAMASRLQSDQRLVNLAVTNVPGPQRPKYFMGAELLEWHPLAPLGGNMTVGIPVVSYNGTLCIGVYTDRDTVPDIEILAGGIRQTIADLHDAAMATAATSTERVGGGDKVGTTGQAVSPDTRPSTSAR